MPAPRACLCFGRRERRREKKRREPLARGGSPGGAPRTAGRARGCDGPAQRKEKPRTGSGTRTKREKKAGGRVFKRALRRRRARARRRRLVRGRRRFADGIRCRWTTVCSSAEKIVDRGSFRSRAVRVTGPGAAGARAGWARRVGGGGGGRLVCRRRRRRRREGSPRAQRPRADSAMGAALRRAPRDGFRDAPSREDPARQLPCIVAENKTKRGGEDRNKEAFSGRASKASSPRGSRRPAAARSRVPSSRRPSGRWSWRVEPRGDGRQRAAENKASGATKRRGVRLRRGAHRGGLRFCGAGRCRRSGGADVSMPMPDDEKQKDETENETVSASQRVRRRGTRRRRRGRPAGGRAPGRRASNSTFRRRRVRKENPKSRVRRGSGTAPRLRSRLTEVRAWCLSRQDLAPP